MLVSSPVTLAAIPTECPICQEPISPLGQKQTECGHLFHIDCLNRWEQTSNTCPVCRNQIGSSPLPSQTSPRALPLPFILLGPSWERHAIMAYSVFCAAWSILPVESSREVWVDTVFVLYSCFGFFGALKLNVCLLHLYLFSWFFQVVALALSAKSQFDQLSQANETPPKSVAAPQKDAQFLFGFYCFYGFFQHRGFTIHLPPYRSTPISRAQDQGATLASCRQPCRS